MKFRLLVPLITVLSTLSLSAGEFTVSTNSYLGGPGDLEEVRGARVQSDGTIVLGAVIGSAAPGGLAPSFLNGADPLTPAAVVRLSQDGQTVLSVTRLSQEIWDLSVDGSDNIYVAAGSGGLLKLNPTATSIIYQKRAGDYIYRVDAAPNGDVACLHPTNYGPNGTTRKEDNTPGRGTIHAYDSNGTNITTFQTWGGRNAVDVAIFDGDGTSTDARIMWIGWRQAYAYTGPSDACGDGLVNGINTTVHIGSIFGATYEYDGANGETELAYQMYDRPESLSSIWLPTAPATLKDRRQQDLNPDFFNGPIDLTDLYTLAEVDAARTDGLNWNDWLWIEEDAGNSFVGCPENIIYQEAFDWYQKGFPDSEEYVDDSFRYPGWCSGRNNPSFVGAVYNTGGNNMADTRGLRLAMGRDGKLYGLFESAGGNTELRWDPYDLTISAPNASGDIYHQFLNIGSAHAITIGRYEPVFGSVELIQEFAPNYRNSVGATISNTIRAKGGDIAADERGRVYFVGASAGELPIPLAKNYKNTPGFNPYPTGSYMGGAHLVVLRPDMSGREYATRLAFGYTHAVDARILGADPLNDSATIVFAGKDNLQGPIWLKAPIQPNPGWGIQDGYYSVLGGTGSGGAGNSYSQAIGEEAWPEVGYDLNFRGVSYTNSMIDHDEDGQVDDRFAYWGFSDTVPLSDGNPNYTGLPFYGGFELVRLNSSTNNLFSTSRTGIKSNGVGIGTGTAAAEVNFLIYFDKADLPGISPTDRLSFDTTTRPSIVTVDNRQWYGARFVVRNGSTFYVSEETYSDPAQSLNFDSSLDDGSWAVYDPASNLDFDQDNAHFAHYDFQDVTGFGLLLDRDSSSNSNGLYSWHEDYLLEFVVNGVANTRPSALIMANPQLLDSGETVVLDGSESADPDGVVSFYGWEYMDNDGSEDSGPIVTTSYPAPGNYKPKLTVYDALLAEETATISVWVGPDPAIGADLHKVIAAYDGDKDFQKWRKSESAGLDLDGDSMADDSWEGATFSETNPIESRSSTSLHGGILGKWIDDLSPSWAELGWDTDGSTEMRSKTSGRHKVHGALFIDKSDFIRGGDIGAVAFGNGSYIEVELNRNDHNWPFRWLVRQGATYYVSQSTFTSAGVHRYTFAESNDGMWAAYDPTTELMDFDAAAASFAPMTFDEVTAFGVCIDSDTVKAGRSWTEMDYIVAEAEVTPLENDAPSASFTYLPATPTAPVDVSFDASASTDDHGITMVHWDFGDGAYIEKTGDNTTPPSLAVDHHYRAADAYDVTLTVTDEQGLSVSQTQTVMVGGNAVTRAHIAATPTNGNVPLNVVFDGSASIAGVGATIVTYDWNFGDGNTLTDGGPTPPAHTYTTPGTFYAKLTVTDDLGASHSRNIRIVTDSVDPIADIAANPTSNGAPLLVNFDASSSTPGAGTITDYIWNFGDGNGASGPTASHSYETVGLYTASLTVFNSEGGSDVAFVQINALPNDLPQADLVADTTAGPLPLAVSFDASGSVDTEGAIVRYDWDFGDGTTLDDGGPTPPAHSYTVFGTYNASVTVTDDLGGQDTNSVTIYAGNEPPVASLTTVGSPNGFIPHTVDFDASSSSDPDGSIVRYDWNFGNGTGLLNGGPTPSHEYTVQGAYTATVTVTDDKGSTDSASIQVEASIQAGDELIYHYTFDTDGGSGTSASDVSGFGIAAPVSFYSDAGSVTLADLFSTDTSDGSANSAGFTSSRYHGRFDQAKYNAEVASGTEEISVVMRLKLTNIVGPSGGGGADDRVLFRFGGNSAGITVGTLNETTTPAAVRLGVGINTKTPSVYMTGPADLSTWKVLAVTWSAGKAKIYVGDDYATLSLVETLSTGQTQLNSADERIRMNHDSSRSPSGYTDDFRVYRKALDLTNLQAIGTPVELSKLPVVTMTHDATDWIFSVPSETGFSYQVLTRTDLESAFSGWDPAEIPQSGTDGVALEFRLPKNTWPTTPRRFFVIDVNPE